LPNNARFVGYPVVVPCFTPITAMLVFLPLLGMVLNGTSSFLYGTIPELAQNSLLERRRMTIDQPSYFSRRSELTH
jgi:hypothetical protein